MDAIFWVLIWIAVPSGGYSEFFGAQADCAKERALVVIAPDTMYAKATARRSTSASCGRCGTTAPGLR